jgi:hypothetical protein
MGVAVVIESFGSDSETDTCSGPGREMIAEPSDPYALTGSITAPARSAPCRAVPAAPAVPTTAASLRYVRRSVSQRVPVVCSFPVPLFGALSARPSSSCDIEREVRDCPIIGSCCIDSDREVYVSLLQSPDGDRPLSGDRL